MGVRTVFISHAGEDRAMAEWVTTQLRKAGYTVEVDLDWRPGDDFVDRMRQALDSAQVMVALLSRAYFTNRYTQMELAAWLVDDDAATRLAPLRVEEFKPPKLYAPRIRADLFGKSEKDRLATLLHAVAGSAQPPPPDRDDAPQSSPADPVIRSAATGPPPGPARRRLGPIRGALIATLTAIALFAAGTASGLAWQRTHPSRSPAAADTTTTARGCANDQAARQLIIGVDLPFEKTSAAINTSTQTVNAIQVYLDQIGSRVAGCAVKIKVYDNSTADAGEWDKVRCLENAKEHVATVDEVAIIGPYNSGCTQNELPVLNKDPRGPILVVSHSNTYPGLTRNLKAGEPEVYYPTGLRNYARVVATDDYQGAAGAKVAVGFARAHRCYVLYDDESYGNTVAERFVKEAGAQGVAIVGKRQWDKNDLDYRPLFEEALAKKADCVYLGGFFDSNGAQLIKDKWRVLGANDRVKLIASDGFSGYADLAQMSEAQGMYLTFPGLGLSQMRLLPGKAQAILDAYHDRYQDDPTSGYVLYAMQALQVVLAAIAASDGTRRGVRDAVFTGAGITIPADDSIVGRQLSIDPATGDVNVRDITILQVSGGKEKVLGSVSS